MSFQESRGKDGQHSGRSADESIWFILNVATCDRAWTLGSGASFAGKESTPESQSWTEGRKNQAAACRLCFKNASRSALIWSALVVGIPCGKPGYTFSVAFFTIFADSQRRRGDRHDLIVFAVKDQCRAHRTSSGPR